MICSWLIVPLPRPLRPPFWAPLASSWPPFGTSWARLGPLSASSWGHLEALWAVLGALGSHLVASWGRLAPLGRPWASPWGPLGLHLAPFGWAKPFRGPFWDNFSLVGDHFLSMLQPFGHHFGLREAHSTCPAAMTCLLALRPTHEGSLS